MLDLQQYGKKINIIIYYVIVIKGRKKMREIEKDKNSPTYNTNAF